MVRISVHASTGTLLTASSAVLGEELARLPGDLGGSSRSTVLRVRRPGGDAVIVKSYPQTAKCLRGFAAEASGLAFSSETGLGPGLLGADAPIPLVIMTDLGEGQTMAACRGRTGDLPAIAAAMRGLLAATSGWGAPDLPVYPAFR